MIWKGLVVAAVAAGLAVAVAGAASGGGAAKGASASGKGAMQAKNTASDSVGHVAYSDQEWQKRLTPDQYRVLRQKGTETAFTGAYWNDHSPGIYVCAACGLTLFDSHTKFDSGTGWPSFWEPIAASHVKIFRDTSYGMVREEVVCARCGGHLGHVFDDGPKPTGQRYCMNSVSLKLEKAPGKTAAR